ncbi:MAG: tripartite tricarboxylate transporter substrate binding protein [Burkholderiales bacterium]
MRNHSAVLRAALGMLLMLGVAQLACAQKIYPSKPIRMIVPFAPGGGVSNVARIIGPKLTESWGQQVVVDNRPGGNTIIGTETLVRSPPDGYTLIMVSSAHVINHYLLPNLPYHALNDFAPVSSTSSGPYVMVAHPTLPANTLQEFIALAKSKPGQLNYSSSGTGGVQHLAGELFNIMAGVKVQHVPYKGAGPAVIELVGGQVHFSFQPPGNVLQHVRSGKLKAIAAPGQSRLPSLPNVPTFAEAGMPGFEVKSWIGILAPAATPKAIVSQLAAEIATIIKMPDTRDKLLRQEHDPMILGPEEFAAFIRADMARVARIIKTANIKIES